MPTLAEFFAQMRALMTNAEAETPEVPVPPPAPVETPDPPADGQQAIVDAVLAALAAQQTPPAETPPATPATPPVPARQSAGPPANPPTNAKSVLQRLIDGETVSDDEIDAAWDDGSITQGMNDRAGARTEVRV